MDNYFLVGFEYNKPVSFSSLGRRRTPRRAVADASFIRNHVMLHNRDLTSIALYRGLCWTLDAFKRHSDVFDLVQWR